MINITSAKPRSAKPNAKIRKWVEQALPAQYEDVVVMVNELQCFEPGTSTTSTATADSTSTAYSTSTSYSTSTTSTHPRHLHHLYHLHHLLNHLHLHLAPGCAPVETVISLLDPGKVP